MLHSQYQSDPVSQIELMGMMRGIAQAAEFFIKSEGSVDVDHLREIWHEVYAKWLVRKIVLSKLS